MQLATLFFNTISFPIGRPAHFGKELTRKVIRHLLHHMKHPRRIVSFISFNMVSQNVMILSIFIFLFHTGAGTEQIGIDVA